MNENLLCAEIIKQNHKHDISLTVLLCEKSTDDVSVNIELQLSHQINSCSIV